MRKLLYILMIGFLLIFVIACKEDKLLEQKNEVYNLLDENKLDQAIAKLKAYKNAFSKEEYYYNLGTSYLKKAGFDAFGFAKDLLDMNSYDDDAFSQIIIKRILQEEAKIGLNTLENVFSKEANASTQCIYNAYKRLSSIYQQNACLLINPSLLIYLSKDEAKLTKNQKNGFMSLPKILAFSQAVAKTATVQSKPITATTLVNIINRKNTNANIEINLDNLEKTTVLLMQKDMLRAMGQLTNINDDYLSADEKARKFLAEICSNCNYDFINNPASKAFIKRALVIYIKGQ